MQGIAITRTIHYTDICAFENGESVSSAAAKHTPDRRRFCQHPVKDRWITFVPLGGHASHLLQYVVECEDRGVDAASLIARKDNGKEDWERSLPLASEPLWMRKHCHLRRERRVCVVQQRKPIQNLLQTNGSVEVNNRNASRDEGVFGRAKRQERSKVVLGMA